jgi:tungstate transport system ATP-binding protein
MAQITFRNIHKHFGRRLILQGADLSLHTGQCFLLTGPNGAGKSTLQRICAGLEKPDKGSVDTGYGKHSWRQVRRILQNQCVYLHQQPYMFDGTVMENLAYALPRATAKAERLAQIEVALHWAGLEPIASAWAKTLSGGERQRVALARASLSQPRYMLLDEPSNNLDEDSRQRMRSLLTSLKSQGIGLLITSHESSYFDSLADGCYEILHGQLVNKLASQHDANIIPITKLQQVK